MMNINIAFRNAYRINYVFILWNFIVLLLFL